MTKETQLALVDGSALTEKDVMSSIDTVLQRLYETGNLTNAVKVVNIMDKIVEVSGKAKAKLLWGISQWWTETGQAEKRNDTFLDYMESETGSKSVTVGRYVNVWKYIENEDIPADVRERPMRDLIPIANALSQGHDFSKENWKKLARASNSSDVLDIIRTIKGKSPRKNGLQIVLDRSGSLNAYKDDQKYYIGFLEVGDDNEIVQKVIQRIVDGAGVTRK